MRYSSRFAFFSLFLATALGCATVELSTGPVEPGTGLLFEAAVLETNDGRTALQIETASGGVVLLDAERAVLARYSIRPDRIEVTDASGGALAELRRSESEIVLSSHPSGDRQLRMTREPDGDLKLSLDGAIHVKLKGRDYGYKMVDAGGQILGRIRVGENQISVRDEAGAKVRSTRAPLSAASVACLVIPGIELAEAGGFSVALGVWGLPL